MSRNRFQCLCWTVATAFILMGWTCSSAETDYRLTHGILKSPHRYVNGEILVKFKGSPLPGAGELAKDHFKSMQGSEAESLLMMLPLEAQGALKEIQGRVIRVHGGTGLMKIRLEGGSSVGRAIEALYGSGAVEYAEPNYSIKAQATPNDPKFPDQWALHNTGQSGGSVDADIDAPEAWSIRRDGSQTVVALIDTGVDYNHPDLKANLWKNPGEIPGDGVDNDENGWIDDVYGMDTYADDSDPMDENGHGTAMAGVVGAVGNNALGVAGVNWKAKMMALRCMSSGGSGDVEEAITGINYALEMKVQYGYRLVLVLGWKASGYSQALRDALRLAQFKGVLVVAAAGNDDEDNDLYPVYPASYNLSSHGLNNILSVGASDRNDLKMGYVGYSAPGSNYGCSSVDLFAPGRDILSTTLKGSAPDYTNAYAVWIGTSMATAHVGGAAALLWSQNPTAKWMDIKGIILNGAEDGVATDFRPICMTWGRLNVRNSIAASLLDDPAIFEVTPAKANAGDQVTIRGSGFGASAGSLSFLFGSSISISSIVSWAPSKIVFTVPASLPKGTGRLQVTTATGTSRGACFSHVSPETLIPGQPLILERGFAASAQVGNNVYIIGGNTSYGLTGLVEKYSLVKQGTIIDCDWKMPVAVSNAGAAAVSSKIYVVGGMDESEAVRDTLQIFDTAAGTWTQGKELPQVIMQPTVVAYGGKVYVFGGLSSPDSNPLNTVYMYDPSTNSWTSKVSMPVAVSYAAGAQYGAGRIWVMGGFTGSYSKEEQRTVQEFNPANNSWAMKPHLIRPRAGAAGINNGTKVFCLHGTPFYYYDADKYADGEWYHPTLGYWMPSILMDPFNPYVAPRPPGLYTPSPGKYLSNIFLLGGVISRSYSETLYSHNIWYFKSP